MSKRKRHTAPLCVIRSLARARSHSAMESMLASGASDLGSSPGVGSLLSQALPCEACLPRHRRGVRDDPVIRVSK